MTSPTRSHGHESWSLADIPYHEIDRARVQGDEFLLYTLAAGSFIEFASDLYTRNLATFLATDSDAVDWLTRRWEREEIQHGQALRRYVETVWPDFPWEDAFKSFFVDYSRFCSVDQLDSTPTLEMAARCVVETGTATFYRMMSDAVDEPVLKKLAQRISSDEVRHYKYFHTFFERYRRRTKASMFAIARNLWLRLGEMRDEDVLCGFNSAYRARHPDREPTAEDYQAFRAYHSNWARSHYPFAMAVRMLAKPLALPRFTRPLAFPILGMIVRRVVTL